MIALVCEFPELGFVVFGPYNTELEALAMAEQFATPFDVHAPEENLRVQGIMAVEMVTTIEEAKAQLLARKAMGINTDYGLFMGPEEEDD